MKKQLPKLLVMLLSVLISISCEKKSNISRPINSWVFRSVLDGQPRMLTIALHENIWLAYDFTKAKLYKVWDGGVNLDGAVYTTKHGPQPTSLGAYYLKDTLQGSPWILVRNGNAFVPKIRYKGHEFKQGHVILEYELNTPEGNKILVREQPEFRIGEDGMIGLEREFTLSNLPAGMQVNIQVSLSSLLSEASVITDGNWKIQKQHNRTVVGVSVIDLQGTLTLKSNTTTTLTTYFYPYGAIEKLRSKEEKTAGLALIEGSDCHTCHNPAKQTIGPSYVAIAKKYPKDPLVVEELAYKIIKGGSGVWGTQVMTAHIDLAFEDAVEMVNYILSFDKEKKKNSRKQKKQTPNGVALSAYVFEKVLTNIPEIPEDKKPTFSEAIPAIDADEEQLAELSENSVLVLTGFINVKKSTKYAFRLVSDGGSRLQINDKVVINHDGVHAISAKDGEVVLKAGAHPFKLTYFSVGAALGISLQWVPHGSDKFTPIPPEVFTHNPRDINKAKAQKEPETLTRRVPGDTYPLQDIHPSYNLITIRPAAFKPRVAGMDFLPDGRLVVSTWDSLGAVYIIDGVTGDKPDTSQVKVKRIATGLAEPLGLKVVDGEIYILQKQELTKLVDLNGDELIDRYEAVAYNWGATGNFHEFAFGLVYQDGYFYGNLATAINPGGASTQPQNPDRGKVIKISKNKGTVEFIAHGLRTPNGIGIGVDQQIFVADNQGDWLPASKIVHVKPNAWYGSRSVDFEGTAKLAETLPVVWLPQDEIGNSPSQPVYLNDGPYNGQMLHGEVTHGGLKRVFVEKVNDFYQGCVFRFTQGLEAGVNRVCWGPDNALYIGGVGSTGNWQHYGKYWYGLQKIKYNNINTFEMLSVSACSNGVEIIFTEALDPNDGWDKQDYLIKQWYYKPTEEYGGPKLDEKELKIVSVNVSKDRRRVFLELAGMKANHVVYIRLMGAWISENQNELWTTEAWYTMNHIPENKQGFQTTPHSKVQDNQLTDLEKQEGWKLLFDGKTTNGWRNFKKKTIGSSWKIKDEALSLVPDKKSANGWQMRDGGDIITTEKFKNFELKLWWKVAENGNSGIMYNVVEDSQYNYVWETGPEMQVLDNPGHPDGKIAKHQAGDLYDLLSCKFITVKPAGKWNKVSIRVKDGLVAHWLNGYKVVEYQLWNEEWKALVAGSKFVKMPGFAKAKKGHISLQDHGNQVWYKNIKIRKL